MRIIYSDHALKRMKQRGFSQNHVEYVLQHPSYVKKTFEGGKEAYGEIDGRDIKVVFFETENYIKIVTIM